MHVSNYYGMPDRHSSLRGDHIQLLNSSPRLLSVRTPRSRPKMRVCFHSASSAPISMERPKTIWTWRNAMSREPHCAHFCAYSLRCRVMMTQRPWKKFGDYPPQLISIRCTSRLKWEYNAAIPKSSF